MASSRTWNLTSATTLYAKWTANTYTVTFNANGGSGSMTAQTYTYGVSQALTANAFTAPTGKHFTGWATTSTGSVAYTNSQSISISADTTLYAVWVNNTYTVRYYRNQSSSDTTYKDVSCTYGTKYNYPTAANFAYTWAGYTLSSFKSATASGTSYTLGAEFSNLTATNGGEDSGVC